jgi:tetratricopeptide (TPR) repeat protein
VLGVTASLIALRIYSWPERDLIAAREALARHQYDAARTSLGRYLEARPNSASAHLLLAQLDRRSNRYADAFRHLDACQRLDGPADAIELERALASIQEGNCTPQLDQLCYEHLHRGDGDEYLILEALSQGYTKTYRLREALACLHRMLILQPDSTYALRRRGWIYEQGEDHDHAEADYRRAVEIDPEDMVARLGLAEIVLDVRQNGPEAAAHFERLWPVRPEAAVALGLAKSWRLLGRGADARRLLDDWLRSHPTDALALAERGQLALDDHATTEGLALLHRAVALAPYLRDANHRLYLVLSQQGRIAEARECQARIHEAEKAHEELGRLLQRVQTAPDDPDLRCQIGQIFLNNGAEEEGLRWLRTALQNHPSHQPTRLALADYDARRGQKPGENSH